MAVPALIVIGASAGGIEPLLEIASRLPVDLQAAVCVVVHFPETRTSVLPRLLQRRTRMPVSSAADDMPIEAGHLYVALPNAHLLVADSRLKLNFGPRQNRQRPAIDMLFDTAARAFGARTIGVVLSGMLDDGAMGLRAIKVRGGLAVVQDPDEAVFDSMPRSALAAVEADYVLPAAEIAAVLAQLAQERVERPAESAKLMEVEPFDDPLANEEEARGVERSKLELGQGRRPGEPTMFTCPDCGGVLWEVPQGDQLRYRCHVGHAFTLEGLRSGSAEMLEEALWTAIRSLEESAALSRRLAYRAEETDNHRAAMRFRRRAEDELARADLVRRALPRELPATEDPAEREEERDSA